VQQALARHRLRILESAGLPQTRAHHRAKLDVGQLFPPEARKGRIVDGLGRFPVTLYKEQWLTLLDMAEDICTFIAANEGRLKSKD
jgi:hypothetical protein